MLVSLPAAHTLTAGGAVAATLPPASVDPAGQDWTPLEGGRPLGGGRCSSTSAVPR
jgi:hypothetical protein